MNIKKQIDPFYAAYRGSFTSLLKWPDLDAFWEVLSARADKGWYIYTTAESPPTRTASADELRHFIGRIDGHLRTEQDGDYCGIVYTDSKTEPTYIKIYDPNNLGVVCGIGREPIFPGWILSLQAPATLDQLPPLADAAKPWWRRILPGGWHLK